MSVVCERRLQGPQGNRASQEPQREAAGGGLTGQGESYVRGTSKAPSAVPFARWGRTRARQALFGTACLCLLGSVALLGSSAPPADAAGGCANETLREEQHSTYLPDCRAYEKVSPADKNG